MPNQSDPNQTQPADQPVNQPAGSAPSVVSPAADLPPFPSDVQASEPVAPIANQSDPVMGAAETAPVTTDQPVNEPIGSAAPSDLPPMVSKPKKKFGGGKIIATVLGLLLLVGGVGVGVDVVSNPVLYQSFAKKPISRWREIGNPKARQAAHRAYDEQIAARDSRVSVPSITECPPGGTACSAYNTNATLPNIAGGYSRAEVLNRLAPIDSNLAGAYCSGGSCPQEWDTDIAGYYKQGDRYYPIDIEIDDIPEEEFESNTPIIPPSPTPSAPGVAVQCQGVKAYDSNWVLLTTTNLSSLVSGDKVNFCVTGTASSGSVDQGQFQINGTILPEITSKRAGFNDFCQEYTIKATDKTITVKAQVHYPNLGWFGDFEHGLD